MSSFPEQARRVRDAGRPPLKRLHALRECVLHCMPYGFHATWHHLVVTARIPRDLDTDPGSLTRAVDELEPAREAIRAHSERFAERRRREKAAGRRVPARPEPWNSWGWSRIAFCPDPTVHPTEPLAVVVRRVLEAHDAGADPAENCPACGTAREAAAALPPGVAAAPFVPLRGGRVRACPVCGVHPGGVRLRHDAAAQERWKAIWRRDPAALRPRSGQPPPDHRPNRRPGLTEWW